MAFVLLAILLIIVGINIDSWTFIELGGIPILIAFIVFAFHIWGTWYLKNAAKDNEELKEAIKERERVERKYGWRR